MLQTTFTSQTKTYLLAGFESAEPLRLLIFDTFSDVRRLAAAFKTAEGSVDIRLLREWYEDMDPAMDLTVLNAITTLLDHLRHGIQTLQSDATLALLVVLYNPSISGPGKKLVIKVCCILSGLEKLYREQFTLATSTSIFNTYDDFKDRGMSFQLLLGVLHTALKAGVLADLDTTIREDATIWIIQTLSLFAFINEEKTIVPFNAFYNESFNDILDIKEELMRWSNGDGFSLLNYPFLFSAEIKGYIIRVESSIQMRHELQDSFFRAMFIGVNTPYLQLEIRRTHIVRDTFCQLMNKSRHDLKKQLRITFVGEEGIDEGGVQKEFFQLITTQMFDASYGMFTHDQKLGLTWFAPSENIDKDATKEFQMLGTLIALAIYNGVILDLKFPLVLYKKLLKIPTNTLDLADIDPDMHEGLLKMCKFAESENGDIEETYSRSFAIQSYSNYGELVTHDLKIEGSIIPLTNLNYKEYIDLYVEHALTERISVPFGAFQEGFDLVMMDSAVSLCRAEELRELVCGSTLLDFHELEKGAKYDGFEIDSPVIRWFWEVVGEFVESQKKILLFFATGSDRVPIGGLAKLGFIIAKNGGDSDRLPTSHTCFNVLLLSEYKTKEKLKDRLLKALDNSDCGFFLN